MLICQRRGCVLLDGHKGRHKNANGDWIWENSDLPVLILATSKEAGELYAKELQVPNYEIELDKSKIQGRRVRSVIISPGYFEAAMNAFHDKMEAYNVGMQTATVVTSNFG